MNRDALNNEWIEAARSWNEYQKAVGMNNYEWMFRECDHPNARRKKDGSRHKGIRCSECEHEALEANHVCNSLAMEWSKVWDLFEAIGMSVKTSKTS